MSLSIFRIVPIQVIYYIIYDINYREFESKRLVYINESRDLNITDLNIGLIISYKNISLHYPSFLVSFLDPHTKSPFETCGKIEAAPF